MQRVLIVQPYVPTYRVPLFEQLHARLDEVGIELEIAAPRVRGDQMRRGDASTVDFLREVRSRSVQLGRISLRWKHIWRPIAAADLVVTELASGALDNYVTAMRPGVRFATWGHGYAATSHPNPVDSALENWQLRRSRHFFAYTEKGRDAALEAGLTRDRITVLRNTVDTQQLSEALQRVSPESIDEFKSRHELGDRRWTCFIGGLDASKRLDFLLAAGDEIFSALPEFGLIVAGSGAQEDLIRRAADERSWLAYVGRAEPDDLATLASIAELLLVPGRVGLVAVDSFVLGLPIVTTRWQYHAPEFAYLADNRNARVTADDVGAFSLGVQSLLQDRPTIERLRSNCLADSEQYDMPSLVARFSSGIQDALAS